MVETSESNTKQQHANTRTKSKELRAAYAPAELAPGASSAF